MNNELLFYKSKLETDGCGKPGRVAMLTQDDKVAAVGPDDLTQIGQELIKRLGLPALAIYEPALPFYNSVINKVHTGNIVVPSDTETRTFLHDIPFIRKEEFEIDPITVLSDLLGKRKGVMIEGFGIITAGQITLEQAYVNASSLFHAIFVKHLLDLHQTGFTTEKEKYEFNLFRQTWLTLPTYPDPPLYSGRLRTPEEIYREMARTGLQTVKARLVDSSFGNISCKSGDTIYISQTGASLDALTGCIDPVSLNNRSTCGITASSELLAHRLIYEQTGDGVILHGHPKFSIVMSMICDHSGCTQEECWNNCPKVRACRDIPIVSGEIGAGGLAEKVSPILKQSDRVIVFGHGVFTTGSNFNEAYDAMLQTEMTCREEFFNRNCSSC